MNRLNSIVLNKIHTIFLCFIFFVGFYPIVNNFLLWFLNWVVPNVPAAVNLVLMGGKDAAIFGLGLLLLFPRKKLFFSVIALVVLSYLFYGQTIVKFLLESFLIVLVLTQYQKQLWEFLNVHKKIILLVLMGTLLFFLAIAYADYAFRFFNHINQDNFSSYPYLLGNNKFRCDKAFFMAHTVDTTAFSKCLETPLNFYKLAFYRGDYIYLPSLFLPIGDSVIFSMLLFYAVAYFFSLHLTQEKIAVSWVQIVFFVLLAVSIFLTLNRVNSFFVLILILVFSLGNIFWLKQDKLKFWVLMMLAFFILSYSNNYLILSIFNQSTPSNIGHTVIAKGSEVVNVSQPLPDIKIIQQFLIADSSVDAPKKYSEDQTKMSSAVKSIQTEAIEALVSVTNFLLTEAKVLLEVLQKDFSKAYSFIQKNVYQIVAASIFVILNVITRCSRNVLFADQKILGLQSVKVILNAVIFSALVLFVNKLLPKDTIFFLLINAVVLMGFLFSSSVLLHKKISGNLPSDFFLGFVLFSFSFSQVYKIHLFHPGGDSITIESNYVRVLSQYNLIGLLFYSYILSVFASLFVQQWAVAVKQENLPQQRLCALFSLIVLTQFFVYQMISPYIVSGYSAFSLFATVAFALAGNVFYGRGLEIDAK